MIKVISNDIDKAISLYPNETSLIRNLQVVLIQAIDDPTIRVDSKIGRITVFNPNAFSFVKLTSLASKSARFSFTSLQLDELNPRIVETYGQLPEFQTFQGSVTWRDVLETQNMAITSAVKTIFSFFNEKIYTARRIYTFQNDK